MKTQETKGTFDGVKKIGDDVKKAGRSMWLAGLGVVAYADEESRNLLGKLVDKGEKFESSDRNKLGQKVDEYGTKVKDMGREVGDRVQGTFQSVMHRAGVPTSDEIHTLIQRVETLTAKVEKMQHKAS